MAKTKYYFNSQTLKYEKVKNSFGIKILKVLGFLSSALVFSFLIIALAYTFLDSPKEKQLKREISALSLQYELLQKKLNQIDANMIIGVYGLGKAQRITQLIHKICPQKNILLHYSIYPIHQIYENAGFNLGTYKHYDRKVMKQNLKNNVYLVPPLTFNSYNHAKDVIKIFASGWENLQKGNHIKLYISDHVDWDDILATINLVKPQEVWTIHGDGNYLKSYFRDSLVVKIL